ncbi:hypothetical protein IID04_04940 [PVC group bacterium]|nr:hypothetical protein [PVC group bacterium]
MMRISFDSQVIFHEINGWEKDSVLKDVILTCVEAQKKAGEAKWKDDFRTDDNAIKSVSPEALEEILRSGKDISDIRTEQNLSNCMVFHTKNLDGTVLDASVLDLRQRADKLICERLGHIFEEPEKLLIQMSGHFWYPPGGYMGWHTNLRKPGWRLYVNYAQEAGKSFFRYRDPDNGRIVTSMDQIWNFRLFLISPEKPFWHAVYSQTNRFSFGYTIQRKP